MAKSLSRKRVSKLSVPSSSNSNPSSNSITFRGARSATTPAICISEFNSCSLRSAATAFGRDARASFSSKRACRCRFEGSTKSRSMIRSRPTPARASSCAAEAPIAPQPTMTALAARSFFCPSSPMLEKRIWREDLSKTGFIGRRSDLFGANHALSLMIAPKSARQATPLCYASSERLGSMRADCVRRLCGAMLAAFLCGGVPASLCSQQVGAQNVAPANEAPLVKNVRVITAGGEVLKVADGVISVEVGKPLDHEQVAASLKSLYRTGVYADS